MYFGNPILYYMDPRAYSFISENSLTQKVFSKILFSSSW